MTASTKKLPLLTTMLVLSIGIGYVQQMAPSPILNLLRQTYALGNQEVLVNLCVSIVHPMTIAASLFGGYLEKKIGIRRLFTWAQLFLTAGILGNFIANTYLLFLLMRIVFSVGFGLAIPFIGSAIIQWYGETGRDRMNTLNGMFPFLGTLISFAGMQPLAEALGSWKPALGLWGIGSLGLLVLWMLLIREQDIPHRGEPEETDAGLYGALWKIRDIRLLCTVFVLDFFCYSYLAVVLPTFLAEAGGMTEREAGVWAALAFPAVGILGSILGGALMNATGRRKPILAAGQLVKLAGILVLTLGVNHSVWIGIAGAAVFGIGNGMWMPTMYAMPMEMEGMTPSGVGPAFALISACGFAAGFVSPVLGGWLTNLLSAASGAALPEAQHVFGLKWSLLAIGMSNLVSFLVALRLKETHPSQN